MALKMKLQIFFILKLDFIKHYQNKTNLFLNINFKFIIFTSLEIKSHFKNLIINKFYLLKAKNLKIVIDSN